MTQNHIATKIKNKKKYRGKDTIKELREALEIEITSNLRKLEREEKLQKEH